MSQINSRKTTYFYALKERTSNIKTDHVIFSLSVHSTTMPIPLYKFTRMIGSHPATVVADASTLQKRFPNFAVQIEELISKLNEAAGLK